MKKLLILLFSLFLLSSPSVFADDLSDFSIEGISIGDSLLDYMTEDEIHEGLEITKGFFSHLAESNRYSEVYLFKDFSTYKNGLSFLIKNNLINKYITIKNEKYTILSIRGKISYIENFDSCIQKRDEIIEVFSEIFPNEQKNELVYASSSDPSGNSTVDTVWFEFDSGAQIEAYCTNFEETFRINKKWSEGLSIAINTSEISRWLSGY
jgi:hypothetical protein